MNFDEARAQFPVLERLAYLNAGSMGPLARATVEAMAAREQADLEQGRGGRAYIDEMLGLRERVRTGLARVLAVDAGSVALTTSTTDGCNIVLGGLDLAPEDEIVTTDVEHFGLLGPLRASGATIRVARVRDLPPEQALDAILAETGARTRLLALSHVSWLTGNLLPIEELREATEIPLLVDGAQSAGAIRVDASNYDFYTLSAQKWLCGPDSTGALYVRDPERLRVARPTYFSQDRHDESGEYTPKAGSGTLRRRLDSDRLARRPRSRARNRPALGIPPLAGRRRALLGVPLGALPGRDRTGPGHARLIRPRRGRRRGGRAPLRAGRRRPRHAGNGLAARLVRVVDERRRPGAPARRPLAEDWGTPLAAARTPLSAVPVGDMSGARHRTCLF